MDLIINNIHMPTTIHNSSGSVSLNSEWVDSNGDINTVVGFINANSHRPARVMYTCSKGRLWENALLSWHTKMSEIK